MQRIILQVPMDHDLKKKAEAVSADMGFSSLQEAIRVLLTKLSKKEFSIKITDETEEVIHLSKAAEKRYEKAVADIKSGKNVTKAKDLDELLLLLRS